MSNIISNWEQGSDSGPQTCICPLCPTKVKFLWPTVEETDFSSIYMFFLTFLTYKCVCPLESPLNWFLIPTNFLINELNDIFNIDLFLYLSVMILPLFENYLLTIIIMLANIY